MTAVVVPAPRIIGRDTELRVLATAVRDAAEHRGGTVFILGEPGIGKSRLAAQTADLALSLGMRVLRGRASATGPAAPFRPISEALFSLTRTGELPTDPELVPYRRSLGRLLPEWRDPADSGGDDSMLVVAEALLRLLSVLGRDRGCLVILEDLHDADAETLAIVDYLADNLGSQPVAVVATARSEAGPAFELARGRGRRPGVTIIEPRRLDPAQVLDLVASCLEAEPDRVPDHAVDRLFRDSDGVPFVVEELLESMVAEGGLVSHQDGWSVHGEADIPVPATVVLSVAHRVNRLGQEAVALLQVAAVLGRRFPVSVVQAVTGLARNDFLGTLRAAVATQLVTPDRPAPEWYSFRHALTADALLAQLGPGERADLARRAADAMESCHPGLPGEWCTSAAELRHEAGDLVAAGRLFAEAGRRTLDDGAAASAVQLLRQANDLLQASMDRDERVSVLEMLLQALADAGQVEEALALAPTLDDAGLSAARRASLHTMLAHVAVQAGLWAQGAAEVATTRALLGTGPAPQLDVIAAKLTLESPGGDRKIVAEQLARRALAHAEEASLPQVACDALDQLGTMTRQRNLQESTEYFSRMAELARQHELRSVQLQALARLGVNENIATGSADKLRRACEESFRVGSITEGYVLEANLVMVSVFRGEFAEATRLAEHCVPVVTRMRLRWAIRYALMAKAAIHAHQGQRTEMERMLGEFKRWDGHESHQMPLVHGLCEAFCALLEENRALAVCALDDAIACEAENPTNYVLAGRHGLRVLLGVLAGDVGWNEHDAAWQVPASRLAWNRQFVLLAKAILLGRDGWRADAATAMAEALEAAAPYGMARHLVLRLGGEAALADGWGDPASWLRVAEAYFHDANVPSVAAACRVLLRQAGVTVSQHRNGSGELPSALRMQGVTVREFEVLRLLAERLGNSEIGRRLYISPRTVEKHVASLIAKTGQPDRAALNELAASYTRQT